jgi:MoaA/NifB/PqqE/SkfB family radical SAM enzyme
MCGRNSAVFKATKFNTEWLSKFDQPAKYVEEVTLMGWGEPTMHSEFTKFLDWANKHKLRKYFCTNGMRLESLAEAILEKQVDVIAISLDGSNSQTNDSIRRGANFGKIINGIKRIIELKKQNNTKWPYMNTVTTLMNKNFHELPNIVKLAHEIGLEEVKAVYLTAFDEYSKNQVLYSEKIDVKRKEEIDRVFTESEHLANNLGIKLKLPHLQNEDPTGKASHKLCFTAYRDFFLGSDGFVRPCMSNAVKFFDISKYDSFDKMWNSEIFQNHRKIVNEESLMSHSCKNCYQSSFANWNKRESFIQTGEKFSPEWE